MNYHEALGRYTELSEQLAAEKVKRHALLHNLGTQAGQASNTCETHSYLELEALLSGAREVEEKISVVRASLAEVASICNKPLRR
jgi:hypothetical protein